ncbi:hypothetical protein [Nonomuraea recticatena]|uniref:Uncharacterized protein n=1 Tax=Nonomuraea recticatena TaxID=46178 RepID=A0ABN3T757_9ACTN
MISPNQESQPLIVTGELAEQVAEIANAGITAEPLPIASADGAIAYVISAELAQILSQTLRDQVLQMAGDEAIPVSLAELEQLAGIPLSGRSGDGSMVGQGRDG